MEEVQDWKTRLDQQIGALSSVPETLEAIRQEQREEYKDLVKKVSDIGERIAHIEGSQTK